MKKLICILLLIFLARLLRSQTIPVFSEYLYNKLLINPSCAGIDGTLSADLFYRNQWIGFDGAPTYESFVAHTPLQNQKIGLGITFMNEKQGPFQQDEAYANYSYKVLSGEQNLSLGIRGGIHYLSMNWSSISTIMPDVAFTNSNPAVVLPNFGLGAYYYTSHQFIGLSVPYLFTFTSSATHGMKIQNDINNYTYMLTAGIKIHTSLLNLTPSFLFKYNQTQGEQIDVNLMLYFFNQKLGIGNSLRIHDAYCLLMDYQINTQLMLGLCYDFPASQLSSYSNGSAEILLRYIFHYYMHTPDPRFL